MARRRPSRRRSAEHVPLDVDRAMGGVRRESAGDGEWSVRTVRGSDKEYVCPGCRQIIPPALEHVVAWAADGLLGATAALDDRRHWHTACWRARGRRR